MVNHTTYSPVGALVAAGSCEKTPANCRRKVYGPVALSDDAMTMRLFRVQAPRPQWSTISAAHIQYVAWVTPAPATSPSAELWLLLLSRRMLPPQLVVRAML